MYKMNRTNLWPKEWSCEWPNHKSSTSQHKSVLIFIFDLAIENVVYFTLVNNNEQGARACPHVQVFSPWQSCWENFVTDGPQHMERVIFLHASSFPSFGLHPCWYLQFWYKIIFITSNCWHSFTSQSFLHMLETGCILWYSWNGCFQLVNKNSRMMEKSVP